MGPFNWFATPPMSRGSSAAPSTADAASGAAHARQHARRVARMAASFEPKELEVVQFKGEPFWLAHRAPSRTRRTAGCTPACCHARRCRASSGAMSRPPGRSTATFTRFPDAAMAEIGAGGDARCAGSRFGVAAGLRRLLLRPARHAVAAGAAGPLRRSISAPGCISIRPGAASSQRSVRITRLRRWLYQGLHSLDFPFLYYQRPLWDIVVIALSIGGTVLSVTTLLPAWRRLNRRGREFGAHLRRRWRTVAPAPAAGTAASLSRRTARREG